MWIRALGWCFALLDIHRKYFQIRYLSRSGWWLAFFSQYAYAYNDVCCMVLSTSVNGNLAHPIFPNHNKWKRYTAPLITTNITSRFYVCIIYKYTCIPTKNTRLHENLKKDIFTFEIMSLIQNFKWLSTTSKTNNIKCGTHPIPKTVYMCSYFKFTNMSINFTSQYTLQNV